MALLQESWNSAPESMHSPDNLRISVYTYTLSFSCSVVSDSATPWPEANLSFTICYSLLKLMSIDWMILLSNLLIFCYPLLFLPLIFPSNRVFSNESALCISWPKYWSFSFRISPSNGYSGLISIRIDRLDLLAVQGVLKSLLQHHSWTFVGKVMSLLFNTVSDWS